MSRSFLLSTFIIILVINKIHANEQGLNSFDTNRSSSNVLLNPFDLGSQGVELFEYGIVLLITIFCINFCRGSRTNLRKANVIADSLDEALKNQFSKVGHASHSGKRLVRDGHQEYWYHASGRIGARSLTARLSFASRHDLFSSLLGLNATDRITFYIPIDTMHSMSILLIRKKEIERCNKIEQCQAMRHAQRFSGEVLNGEEINLSSELVVMTEHRDLLKILTDGKISDDLKLVEPFLESFHISNTGVEWDQTCKIWNKLVRLQVKLPNNENEIHSLLQNVSKLCCKIADSVSRLKVSKAAGEKIRNIRRIIQEMDQIEQMNERRKIAAAEKERKKRIQEESVNRMSREKQIKYEERKRKKQFKDRLKKSRL